MGIYKLLLFLTLFAVTTKTVAQQSAEYHDKKLKEFRYSKHLDSSRFHFIEGVKYASIQNDSNKLFYLHKHMGDAYEHHQKLDSTLYMYELCEKFIQKNNYKLKSFLLNDKSYTYQLLYDYDKSAELVLEALKFAEKSNDSREIASVAISVADGFSRMSLNDEADSYYKQAIKIAMSKKDTGMLSYAYRYYANHLIDNFELTKGYYNLKEAIKYSCELKDSISLAFGWHNLSTYFWQIKQVDSAFYYEKKAEHIWEVRAEYIDYSNSLMKQGKYYLELNNFKEAEKNLKKAEKYILNDLYFNSELYGYLAELYNKIGQSKVAFDYLLKAKNLSNEISEKESKAKLMGLRVKFQTDQKEKIILQEKEKSAIALDEAKNKTKERNTILIILILSVFLLTVIVYSYFKIKKKNNRLSELNKDLELSSLQKMYLLKEVHHRVKNNLTTLKSLFYLQAKASNSTEVKAVLEESQLRIQSMALIHQSLYEENENEKVEFKHFLQQLFNELELSIKPPDKDIEIIFKGLEINLDISTALFLGLILNELATNSFKYAFKDRDSGSIEIELISKNKELLVHYSDSGIGLKNGFELSKGGFGFKLLSILTQQINAKLTYQKTDIASIFTIEIPLEQ